ncbi:MAG TPA: tripartite tricarboxylate transporter substrate binding protein [Burkholderiales bacterium]|nr:tripartite tricarboxylate transporter substrate binding protein [Burkholderiales bacterium]
MSASRILLVILAALVSFNSHSQTWPTKPVRFIVPYPPGGTVDPLARLLGIKLGESLGQQFVVENRPGAGGAIGTAAGARSAPDGYTFVFVFDAHAVNHSLLANAGYDPQKDFASVMVVGTAPYAIATLASKPYASFADVVKAAKANPGGVSVGSIGNGTLAHLILVLAQQAGGFQINHIPFKGGGPMTQAVLGGQVDLGIGSAALLTPHVKGGKMRAVAVTGDKRAATLPDVATLGEQGIPGVVVHAWWGIVAPAGTPRPIIDRFHAELAKAISLPEVKKVLAENIGMELLVSTPEQMDKFVAAEAQRWAKVIRDNNIRAD